MRAGSCSDILALLLRGSRFEADMLLPREGIFATKSIASALHCVDGCLMVSVI